MKLLLDAHIWIWSLIDPEKLSARVSRTLENPDNQSWLSPISLWEVLMLGAAGRIAANVGTEEWIRRALQEVPLQEAPLTHEVALETRKLQLSHRDPADRFLAATARVFGLTIVTADERLIGAKGLSILANR